MLNDNDDRSENDDMPTKSNPALTDDCEGKHALSPRAAAAEMARSPIVHVMESSTAVPIDDYKALPVLALDDPDFPGELRGFGVVNGVPMLDWRQCPWNPDVLLAIVYSDRDVILKTKPQSVGVLVYHRWDGFGVDKDSLLAESNPVGMMDLRLTLEGMEMLGVGKFGLTKSDYDAVTNYAGGERAVRKNMVFSRAAIVGEAFTNSLGNQRQEHVGTDLLYATRRKCGTCLPWGTFRQLFSNDNYAESRSWSVPE